MSNNAKIGGVISNVTYSVRKHSPELLMGAGIVGMIVGAVLACKATIKADEVMKSASNDIKKIKESTDIDEKEAKKEKVAVYAKTSLKLAKLYSVPVTIGAVSIASILTSHSISHKRYSAMAAAYATVDRGFKAYRKNVVERFGEEVDHQLRYNITPTEVKEKVTDENGKTKTVKNTINVAKEDPSDYARFFDESNPYWQKDADINKMFLRAQQSFFNDKLKVEKRVFLNDVYKALGFPTTKAGQVVGWIYDPDRDDIDNYIDFGIWDVHKAAVRDFVNGYERSILLDFNVDGNIWKDM